MTCPEDHDDDVSDHSYLDEPLFCHYVFKFILIKTSVNAHFLEMGTFWWPENLNLALRRASIMLLVLRLGVDGQYDLAMYLATSLALSKGTAHNLLGV